MTWNSVLLLALALPAQVAAPGEAARDGSAARLDFMKASVKGYAMTRPDDPSAPIRVLPEPAFKIGKQPGEFADGAIFLWADEVGRPEAAAQVFLLKTRTEPEGFWLHEFTSLSTHPLVASERGATRWRPAQPGVTFRPLPDAPRPGASPALRLRQMRAIAGGFKAEDDFGDRGWQVVRLLTTPISRYGKAGGTPEDGALFAFVIGTGTDPEVFLFIEDRLTPEGPAWQYALAPMTCFALKVRRDGQTVWTLPRRDTEDPSRTFHDLRYKP